MKTTITRVASNIIDLAGELGVSAEALAVDPGIAGAEAVVHLRDALRCLKLAKKALALAIARQHGDPFAGREETADLGGSF